MKILFLILISISCLAQNKNVTHTYVEGSKLILTHYPDSTIAVYIPPTLEARMIAAEQALSKAKEEAAKAQKEIDDGIKILFEIVGKKPEEYEVTGYTPGVLKIKRKPIKQKP